MLVKSDKRLREVVKYGWVDINQASHLQELMKGLSNIIKKIVSKVGGVTPK